MEIKITQLTPWSLACNLARATVGKPALTDGKEPSDEFKHNVLDAEHSVIRAVMYRIDLIGIPYYLSVHLVRHKHGVEHFVSTQRSDRTGINRDEKPQNAPVNHTMIINAQEVMFVSRRRLCGKAAPEMRVLWRRVCNSMSNVDPVIAQHMVPMCLYRGGVCYEINSCGVCRKASKT